MNAPDLFQHADARDLERAKIIAASGSSGLSRAAQAEVRTIRHRQLAEWVRGSKTGARQ